MAQILTQRLLLRPARPDDAGPLHAIFRNPETMRYWSRPPHRDLAETEQWLLSMLAIAPHEGEDFIVEHSGTIIGKAGLYRFPEIGFIFAPEFWGQGLAREALTPIIARAFAIHRLARIIADVDPRNAASLALLGRLGFCETGFRERSWLIGGECCDSVDLALTPDSIPSPKGNDNSPSINPPWNME
jgi:ribosomal-protein-alanine N-acetyltransferase